jgi:hypothetical protein
MSEVNTLNVEMLLEIEELEGKIAPDSLQWDPFGGD